MQTTTGSTELTPPTAPDVTAGLGLAGKIAAAFSFDNPYSIRPFAGFTIPRHRLWHNGSWALSKGLDPQKLKNLRAVIPKHRGPTYAILDALERESGGSIAGFAARLALRNDVTIAQSLLDGGKAWPSKPRRHRQARPSVIPFSETIASYMLPPTWDEVGVWYREQYPLRYRIASEAPAELVSPGDAPLEDWSQYWAPDLHEPRGPVINERVVNLAGIPHVDDNLELERALTGQPYLCIVDDWHIRNGASQPPEQNTILVKAERTLLNLIMLYELRTGRAVSYDKLSSRSGILRNKLDRHLQSLEEKINNKGTARTLVKVRKDHIGISDSALVVDCRPYPDGGVEDL